MYKMFEYPKDILVNISASPYKFSPIFLFPMLIALLVVFLKGLAADIYDCLTPSTPNVDDSYNNRL
jgi:hypothetical protein